MKDSSFEAALRELAKNGEFSNKTSGRSMYPMLVSGKDIITVKPARFPLCRNEVILYRKAGMDQLVLHRVIKALDKGGYLVRGDNTYKNERVYEKDIAGVLSGFYKSGKYHNCRTDKGYRVYVALTRFFYPARFLWARGIKPAFRLAKRAAYKALHPKKSRNKE